MRRAFRSVVSGLVASVCMGAALAASDAQAPAATFRSSGDFRVAMFLTKDPLAFRAAAKKSLSALAEVSAGKVQIGQSIYAAMMFGGCKASVTNTCTVSAVFRITPPKGKPVSSDRIYLWRVAAPAAKSIQLGEQPFAITLEKADPGGLYEVEVEVLDHNANATVTLKADFLATR